MTNIRKIISVISEQFKMPEPRFRVLCRDRCQEECSALACYDPRTHTINLTSMNPPVELVAHEVGHAVYRYVNNCHPWGNTPVNATDNENYAREVEAWASRNFPTFDLGMDIGVSLLEGFGRAFAKTTDRPEEPFPFDYLLEDDED